jgi:hypothetical protein
LVLADLLMPGLVHPFVAMAALAGVAIGPGAVTLAPAVHALPPAVQAAPAPRCPSRCAMTPAARQRRRLRPARWREHAGEDLADAPWRQVRIEQRLIIRITPGMGRDLPPPPPLPQPMLVPHGRRGVSCVALGGIAAIAPSSSDNQIVLLLRDRRQIVANLEKSCSARDFYVGFYAERSADGMLCTGRDVIHSRAGASCTITRLQQVGR